MISQLFKIIWKEKKVNLWILLELVLAFTILWFCSDTLIFSLIKMLEPKGFNIDHTYMIDVWNEDEDADLEIFDDEEYRENAYDALWTIFERINNHPAIEHASLSIVASPYSGSYWGNCYFVDSIRECGQYKFVSPEFFDVFQIELLKGRTFDYDANDSESVIISAGANNLFAERNPFQIDTIESAKRDVKYNVIGVANKTKRMELEEYRSVIYHCLTKEHFALSSSYYNREFCVRVKPSADNDFVNKFFDEMVSQLDVGPYFMASITPMSDKRKEYFEFAEYDDEFKSIFAFSAFLIVNIVLCVMGTFWLRIQSRRADIGLRMALGATKKSVQSFFILEALLLLFLASIIAFILCININEVLADVLENLGLPITGNTGFKVYITNYIVTLAVMAIIAVLSVWYPAKRASKINSVESLRIEN
ncbi:FtsX-like permease family protein [Bacteroidales bacterium OttesenSCG-928-K22]|nr:FtsX-like permease family protein [Bacteroidales bacterium OttesenSCG-928-K22]